MTASVPADVLEPPAIHSTLRSARGEPRTLAQDGVYGEFSLGARLAYGAWLMALFGLVEHLDVCPFDCTPEQMRCLAGVYVFDDEQQRWEAWHDAREQPACNGTCRPPVYAAGCPYHGAGALRLALSDPERACESNGESNGSALEEVDR